MEVEDDDVFFANLSRQIALLIMDDSDDDPVTHSPSVAFHAFPWAWHPIASSPLLYEQTHRRESKGTGVFIPRLSLLRRKRKEGKIASFDDKSNRQPDKSRGAYNASYRNDPSCNSRK